MYRLGLSRKRIAELVRVHPAVVGYHLVIARRREPELEAEHQAAAGARTSLSPRSLARMEEVIAWISAEGRLPRGHAENRGERSMARWLSERRREAAEGILDPAYRDGLARVPEWAGKHRAAAGEARWHDRLAQLVEFRHEGHDWPRHHDYDSEREHTLGVWIHAQRYKRRRGDLDPTRIRLLDEAVPGWQAGRTRGRPPRR
ncbi:helicase associated domain-containing protein [Arthrobacter sp. TB 26]|uniref:helicase associated domain-containing protein n=1 Tax=Arthrobacter sp. TB 26 TaxID=494420 RepID=UPI00041A017A|nr:helicase associated domain-containing protein [Arthrobacter sp. TB 26]